MSQPLAFGHAPIGVVPGTSITVGDVTYTRARSVGACVP